MSVSALHLVSNPEAVESCLALVDEGDAVLFVGDGVYAQRRAENAHHCGAVRFGVLGEDAEARGVAPAGVVEVLTYDGFVEWVAAFPRTVTWR